MAIEIDLKVIRNEVVDYKYTFNQSQFPTQKLQIVLQSKLAEQYCLGVARLHKKHKSEL